MVGWLAGSENCDIFVAGCCLVWFSNVVLCVGSFFLFIFFVFLVIVDAPLRILITGM